MQRKRNSIYPNVPYGEWRTRLEATRTGSGLDTLVILEQLMYRSKAEGVCAECGEPGAVVHRGSTLIQAVPYYFLCDRCDAYFEGSVGCNRYTVLAQDDEQNAVRIVASLNNARNAANLARQHGGTVRDNHEAVRPEPCGSPDCYACASDCTPLCAYRVAI